MTTSSLLQSPEPLHPYHYPVAMMTFPPDMHVPCPSAGVFGIGEYRHMMANGQYDEEEPHMISFPSGTQKSVGLRQGTLDINYYSSAYDKNITRAVDDIASSSSRPRSPFKDFQFVPTFHTYHMYPKPSSPIVVGETELRSSETVNNSYVLESSQGRDAQAFSEPVMHKDIYEALFGPNAQQEQWGPLTFSDGVNVSVPSNNSPADIDSSNLFLLPASDVSTSFRQSVDNTITRNSDLQPFKYDIASPFNVLPRDNSITSTPSVSMSSPSFALMQHMLQSPLDLSTPILTGSNYTLSPVCDLSSTLVTPVSPKHRRSYATSGRSVSQKFRNSTRGSLVADRHGNAISQLFIEGETSGQPPGPVRRATTTSAPSTSSSTSNAVIKERLPTKRLPVRPGGDSILESAFQDDANTWRRVVLENIMRSSFYHNDELEPDDLGINDSITMGYGRRGKSIFGVFVQEVEKGEWKCLFSGRGRFCSNSPTFKRFERAIEHVRSHLNHRPYACTGECNLGATCKRRFFAQQYLRDHLTRKEKAPCKICGRSVLVQNLSRHNQLRHNLL